MKWECKEIHIDNSGTYIDKFNFLMQDSLSKFIAEMKNYISPEDLNRQARCLIMALLKLLFESYLKIKKVGFALH
jgi:hypothetical protein